MALAFLRHLGLQRMNQDSALTREQRSPEEMAGMEATKALSAGALDRKVGFKLVDSDCHAYTKDGLRDVVGFLPQAWRRRFEVKGLDLNEDAMSYRFANPHEGGALRRDARPPGGGSAGSDPEFLVRDHIDHFGIDCAILNNLQVLSMAAVQAQPDESVVLCAAFNDFFLERWMPVDERFRYAMTVPAQDPQKAAAEIRRLGGEPRVVAVFLPLLYVRMGNRYYYPIYEAAAEMGLPVIAHPTSTDFIYQGAGVGPGGWPETYAEMYAGLPVMAWSNTESLILTGTFDRFPELKVVFVEFGFSWALPLMWRMDKAWEGCRFEVPWVKLPPSEYVRKHIRFTTQPVDEPKNPKDLYRLVEMLGSDLLLFSTDYPHWDGDTPAKVLQGLPETERERIFAGNAQDVFPLHKRGAP